MSPAEAHGGEWPAWGNSAPNEDRAKLFRAGGTFFSAWAELYPATNLVDQAELAIYSRCRDAWFVGGCTASVIPFIRYFVQSLATGEQHAPQT